MTRQDLMEMANINTERKSERILDMGKVFTIVLQDFCGRNRYWWRKMSVSFNTVLGQATYDLTSVVTTPALTEMAVEEVTVLSLVQIGQNPPVSELTPVFDDETINEMIEGVNINGASTPASPSRYCFDANSSNIIRIDIPDGVYKLRAALWAMPNPSTDSTNQSVPLVPAWHHKAILDGMEAYIWSKIYGPTNPKYITAKKDYEDAILLAQARPSFTTNRTQQLIQSEDSIRSTS